MFDITKPVFGNWKIEEELGSGSFGTVYKIKKEDFGKTYYSAMKVIKIPQNNSEIKTMVSELGDVKTVSLYYENFVKDFAKEIELMSDLKGCSEIVSIEDHVFIPGDDEISWTVLIKMELLTPFVDYYLNKNLSQKEVMQLGIEICKALEICDSKNIIHRDIKPDNIFVTNDGHFKIGDFGIAREVEKTTGGLSKKGTYTYMAPEVYKGEKYNKTVDIYSLGLVLYKLLNNNRDAFLPPYPQPITYTDRENSRTERFNGTPIPEIDGISIELNSVVLKACAYKPEDRYSNPTEFRKALQEINPSDSYILGNVTEDDSEFTVEEQKNACESDIEIHEKDTDIPDNNKEGCIPDDDIKPEKRKKTPKGVIIGVIVAVICIMVAGVLWFFIGGPGQYDQPYEPEDDISSYYDESYDDIEPYDDIVDYGYDLNSDIIILNDKSGDYITSVTLPVKYNEFEEMVLGSCDSIEIVAEAIQKTKRDDGEISYFVERVVKIDDKYYLNLTGDTEDLDEPIYVYDISIFAHDSVSCPYENFDYNQVDENDWPLINGFRFNTSLERLDELFNGYYDKQSDEWATTYDFENFHYIVYTDEQRVVGITVQC